MRAVQCPTAQIHPADHSHELFMPCDSRTSCHCSVTTPVPRCLGQKWEENQERKQQRSDMNTEIRAGSKCSRYNGHGDQTEAGAQLRRPSAGAADCIHLNKGPGVSCWTACLLAHPPPTRWKLRRIEALGGLSVISALHPGTPHHPQGRVFPPGYLPAPPSPAAGTGTSSQG